MIHGNDDGTPNVVTYLFTDNHGRRIEDLPLSGVSFSLALCASGQFSGTLQVEDPQVRALNWLAATAPNLAQVWVDIDGTLVYGGRVTKRAYQQKTGTVTVSAMDHFSYLSQRLQAGDYSTQWVSTPNGAAQIAHTIAADALASQNSLSLSLSTPAATPGQYGITLAAPRQQRMTVDALVQQISQLGWQVGFDFATDVAYVAGTPTATLTLSYPRRGRVAGTTGLVFDVGSALDFSYDEDGTAQANSVAQTSTGTGGVSTVGTWTPSMAVDGYPLLEKVAMHTSFSATATPQSVLAAFAQDDLALASYPVVTPQVTMPMFGEPSIGEWIVGDDARVLVPKVTLGVHSTTVPGQGTYPGASTFPGADPVGAPMQDPRFPNGMDFYWRITKADCTIPTEGVPTTVFTFNMPPSSTPQRPPL